MRTFAKSAAVVLGLLLSSPAAAGLGLGLGFTSSGAGLSVATTQQSDAFLQGFVGPGWGRGFVLNGDYCFTAPLSSPVNWYAGPGVSFRSYGTGLRIPLGIVGRFAKVPLQLGGELSPTVLFNRGTWAFIDASVYLRFLFK